MKLRTIIIPLASLLLLNLNSYSQLNNWGNLPNKDVRAKTDIQRFDDIYFTDYLTGTSVDLDGSIYKTKDGGNTWYFTAPPSTTEFRSVEFSEDGKIGIIGSLSSDYGLMPAQTLRSTDGGETWKDISNNISDTAIHSKYQKAICGLSHYKNNFYGVGWYGSKVAHFYKSTDNGTTWETYYVDTSLATGLVDVIFISENVGFASGTKNTATTGGASVVLKTIDGGKTWTSVFYDETIGGTIWKLQKIDSNHFVGSIQPRDRETVAMIKSTDAGNNWMIVNTGFKIKKVIGSTQAIGFVSPLKGWLGGWYSGMYETTDGGLSWDSVSFGVNLNRFFVFDSTHAYAAGQSIYRYGTDFTVKIDTDSLKSALPHKLYPVSPNPSAGKIKIEFDLGTHTMAILQVINIDTRQRWEVSRDVLSPGHYTYYWNEASAPSGNYMVRLDNNEIVVSEKFILVR